MTRDPKTTRRDALRGVAAGGALASGVLAAPVVRFLGAPARSAADAGRWAKATSLESLEQGEPRRVALLSDRRDAWMVEKDAELGSVWLLRRGDAVLAWNAACPHLGCTVNRAVTGAGFDCPCHESSFDTHGRRLSGPSPRDLDALPTRIENGVVLVEFQRFRLGTPAKDRLG
jgi:menaquinol-cytochrome c reductase iron-sulfur subunit